jgi:hypothetical protein
MTRWTSEKSFATVKAQTGTTRAPLRVKKWF